MTAAASAVILSGMRSAWNVTLLAVAILAAGGCGPSAVEGGFDSANPAARMYAIENAARTGDVGAARQIVEQLDSDDPAVRLLAIGALERLTGQTLGYCHADEPADRRLAIGRWRQKLDEEGVMRVVQQVDEPMAETPVDDG